MGNTVRKSDKIDWEHYWAGKGHVGEVYSTGDRVVSQILRATPVSGKRVLEVGAGTGRDGLRLLDAGAEVFLVDYAEHSLLLIKDVCRRANKRVFLVKGDALALPFRNDRFDVVFHQGLLEHFRDPKPLLGENYRVLRPAGLCLIDVPQKFHVYTLIKHVFIWFNAWFAGWETEFSVRSLGELLRSVGFRVRLFYGDWMRPSLFYRMVRELLMCIGLRLPMYPRGIKVLRSVRAGLRRVARRFPVHLYTCLDIGVVAEKPFVPEA